MAWRSRSGPDICPLPRLPAATAGFSFRLRAKVLAPAVKSPSANGHEFALAEAMNQDAKPTHAAIVDSIRRAARQEQFLEVVSAAEATAAFRRVGAACGCAVARHRR